MDLVHQIKVEVVPDQAANVGVYLVPLKSIHDDTGNKDP